MAHDLIPNRSRRGVTRRGRVWSGRVWRGLARQGKVLIQEGVYGMTGQVATAGGRLRLSGLKRLGMGAPGILTDRERAMDLEDFLRYCAGLPRRPWRDGMTEHTPGPWRVREDSEGRPPMHSDLEVVAPGSTADRVRPIARLHLQGRHAEANAHLIAAAPEMLTILEHLCRVHGSHQLYDKVDWNGIKYTVAKAKREAR